jgi:gas vesicle protein
MLTKSKLTTMNTKNLIGGLMAGAALGVAIGMLLAPDTGSKTREQLATGARKLTDGLKSTAMDSIHLLKDNFISILKEVVAQAKDTAAEAKNQTRV